MIVLKNLVTATILVAPVLLAGVPAQAFTARQATSQGQGVYVTSSGMPANFVASGPVTQQGDSGNRRPLRSLEHHDRYFAGS